jgi:hypothetical protein
MMVGTKGIKTKEGQGETSSSNPEDDNTETTVKRRIKTNIEENKVEAPQEKIIRRINKFLYQHLGSKT